MKKISPTEKLAIMVKRGFDDMNARFDDIENRMVEKSEFNPFKNKVEVALYELQTDMVDVKTRLINVEGELVEIKGLVFSHEKRITTLETVRA